ncbi:MAG: flavodoxin domain-containing protein [Pseudomonadota bacterium]
MKCAVIYFSLTGSTRKIAEKICEGLASAAGQCDLFQLEDVDMSSLEEYDLVGVGAPVWHLAEPMPVRIFLLTVPMLTGQHWFMFATHCADRGGIFYNMGHALRRKGVTVVSSRSWYGEMWMPVYPKPYPTDGHPDDIDLTEALEYGREVVDLSRRIHGEKDLAPEGFGKERDIIPPTWVAMRHIREKCFYPKCRLCEDNCPMGAISLADDGFFFRRPGRCVNCLFCEIICPTGAIEADYEEPAQAALGRVREGVFKLLEKAAERGYFRQLLPMSEIDPDTPMYKTKKWGRRPRLRLSSLP